MFSKNRAVITGLGVVAPNGIGVESFWETLISGQSAIAPITRFDPSEFNSRIAGEIKHFDPCDYLDRRIANRLDRNGEFGIVAAELAIKDAKLDPSKLQNVDAIPIVIGAVIMPLDICEAEIGELVRHGPLGVAPVVDQIGACTIASAIANYFEFPATNHVLSSACVAGLDAIAKASSLIFSGKSELVIAGASEAPITPFILATLGNSKFLSLSNDTPEKASRPFDLHRDGGLLAEGAGIVILENYEHALERGVTPYLEVTGFGQAGETSAEKKGAGLKRSMTSALSNASYLHDQIDYISTHAPSDPVLDQVETDMIKEVFGNQAYSIPVPSIKGVTGNPFATAGLFQVIGCALSMQRQTIPPTANLETPDPNCDLDYVADGPRITLVTRALVNGHGFGGYNTTLAMERVLS